MNALAISSTGIMVMASLAVVVIAIWGWGKYKDYRAEQRSEDLRKLYSDVHTQPRK